MDKDAPGRPGIEVPKELWDRFTKEAMCDGKDAAQYAADVSAYLKHVDKDNVSGGYGDSEARQAASRLRLCQAKPLSGFFQEGITAVKHDSDVDADKWREQVNEHPGALVKEPAKGPTVRHDERATS